MMQLTLPEPDVQVHLVYPHKPKMSPDEFYDLCQANPNLWFELTAEGEIIVMPPAGTASGFRSLEVARRLANWADEHGGRTVDASAGFLLPDGSVRAPDAAWIRMDRLAALSPAFRDRYVPLAPDFIVEVMSPSDRLADAKQKMQMWMSNGVQLGWLIQPEHRTVFVYRKDSPEPSVHHGVTSICGEGPVDGFVLNLERIWEDLY